MEESLGNIGEFGLIERLTRGLNTGEGVIAGIGDDCAVIDLQGRQMLVSCDAFIENVHFSRKYTQPEDAGWKAANAALSDIAAMGGSARFVLVSLACPPEREVLYLDELYKGIRDAADAAGAVIVGGNVTQNPGGVVIDTTVIGEVSARYILRSSARAGDVLAVAGTPGLSAAGLHCLQIGIDAPDLVRAHHRPQARIKEGQWLATQTGVRAMIDLSDGLVQDAGHICEASKLSADIDSGMLPVHPELEQREDQLGRRAEDWVLTGGEEYELIVALDPQEAKSICRGFREHFGLPLTVVGRFSNGKAKVTVDGESFGRGGWDHFGPR